MLNRLCGRRLVFTILLSKLKRFFENAVAKSCPGLLIQTVAHFIPISQCLADSWFEWQKK